MEHDSYMTLLTSCSTFDKTAASTSRDLFQLSRPPDPPWQTPMRKTVPLTRVFFLKSCTSPQILTCQNQMSWTVNLDHPISSPCPQTMNRNLMFGQEFITGAWKFGKVTPFIRGCLLCRSSSSSSSVQREDRCLLVTTWLFFAHSGKNSYIFLGHGLVAGMFSIDQFVKRNLADRILPV